MVLLEQKLMGPNEQELKPISQFCVWFSTPYGLMDNMDAAIERCRSSDLEPELCVKPVAVAISVNNNYEVVS